MRLLSPLHRLAELPQAYTWVQEASGWNVAWKTLLQGVVCPGDRVLDIGCGTAIALQAMPDVAYTGIDRHEPYVRWARERRGRGSFAVGDAEELVGQHRFDVVLALGLLHHLDDDSARRFLARAAALLADEGCLLAVDGCSRPGQSLGERFFLGVDRGRHIRDQPGYESLAMTAFSEVDGTVHRGLLRVPYACLAMLCRRPPGAGG